MYLYCCPVKIFQAIKIRVDISHEVSTLLVIIVKKITITMGKGSANRMQNIKFI